MAETRLRDKVVLVTGANSGIGAVTAKAFAAEGAAVVVHFLAEPAAGRDVAPYRIEHSVAGGPAADEVVNHIWAQGGRAAAVPGDLSDPATIPLIFDRAEEAFGRVDVLVNNAAHCELPDTIYETSPGSSLISHASRLTRTNLGTPITA